MDSVSSKKDLHEQGSRYTHYMELKEVFLLGIDVIDKMNPNYVGESDRALRVKLGYAVDMITRRIDYLSGFTPLLTSLARQVDEAGISRQLMLEEADAAKAKSQNTNRKSDPKDKSDPPADGERPPEEWDIS